MLKTFILVIFFAFSATAADMYRINNSTNTDITEHGYCKNVANATGRDIMVPTKTSPEFVSFFSNPPAGITITDLTVAPTYLTLTAGERRGNTSVTKHSGLQVDDLMIVNAYRTGTFTGTPTGWTVLDNNLNITGSYYIIKWYKFATAGDVAAGTLSFTIGGSNPEAVMMNIFRGANTTSPFPGHTVNLGSATTMTFTSFTATLANTILLAIGEGASSTPGDPTGFTTRWTSAGDGTTFSTKVQATPGSTGSVTATSIAQDWGASLIGINGKCP